MPNLARMSEAEMLRTRIRDLDLNIEESSLAPRVAELYRQLAAAGLPHLRPAVYLGDEWFSPAGVVAISIPFWLSHPRLARLEKRLMRQVEGGTRPWCMRLLRHEAGHCFDHAFQLSARQDWQQVFGSPAEPYRTERYRVDKTSRDFVINLEDHYAQCHPEEDFAETFAVLVDPDSNWTARYRGWPGAMRKLRYVRGLIRRFGSRVPDAETGPQSFKASRMSRTLSRYYEGRVRTPGSTIT